MRNLILILAIAGLIVFLSGCPGGGGSDSDATTQTSATGGMEAAQSTGRDTAPPADVKAAKEKPASDNQLIIGAGEDASTKCAICGMDASASPSELVYEDKHFDGLGCWSKYVDENKCDFTAANMLDYSTFEGEKAYLPLISAFYVEVKSLPMTMPPFIVAFATKEAAKAFGDKEGCPIMAIEEMVNRVKAWSMEGNTDSAKGETASTGGKSSGCCGGKSCNEGKDKKEDEKGTTT